MSSGRFWRRLRLGLPTVLGLRPGGFFIPYRYAADVPPEPETPIPWIESRLAAAEVDFQDLLTQADGFSEDLLAFAGAGPPMPRWEQSWFPRLDGLAAYVLTRSRRPLRIVEVGSGHSTRFFAAGLRDGRAPEEARIFAIDPVPRADIAALPVVEPMRALVQSVDPGLFASLGPGDILAIDSSHIAMPGSDVDILFTRILPALKPGVLVQIHDVFLPDPYPRSWRWRGYNEQGMVGALLAGGTWRPIWSSHYVSTRMSAAMTRSVAGRIHLPKNAYESALWLEKL